MESPIVYYVEKIKKLEKKLDIAVKALKKYADEDEWLDGCPIKPTALSFAKCCYAVNGYEEAQQALKEIEE